MVFASIVLFPFDGIPKKQSLPVFCKVERQELWRDSSSIGTPLQAQN